MTELEQILDFTEDDLAANRAGHLSQRQRRRLYKRVLFTDLRSFVSTLILSWAAGLMLYFLLTADPKVDSALIFLLILIGMAINTILFGSVVVIYLIRLKRDIDENRVLFLEGPIRFDRGYRGPTWIECQHERLWADNRIQNAFYDGAAYQFHYLPHSKFILSAVAVEAEGTYK